jgi:hypothetical protein
MKELINVGRYKEALDLFDHPSQVSNDFSLSLALKACTKLGLRERGIQIHQGLSSKSLSDPFIQATLIHFYMQCKDVDRAEEIFSVTHRNSPVSISAIFDERLRIEWHAEQSSPTVRTIVDQTRSSDIDDLIQCLCESG